VFYFVKGNTCFMNSTLQCLAHTDPLRRYFLSGAYVKDLNRDNPLGTGGDLATEFSTLLAEMWGTAAPSGAKKIETSSYISSASSVVYPRSFKFTLGKHAEQFIGYDQHDSQELATYLLDALHEDTNRVTQKPYVEKAEQGEDEPDDVAAKKAWDLHLKREDSRVLENFMGQVKSRVQCCKEGCGRVSTTFDPFMYLSVPIPGSMDRTMRVTFVPLDGKIRKKELSVTLNRAATIGKFVTKVIEQLTKAGFSANGNQLSMDDLCVCDVWTHEVYAWYGMDDEIDKIRESDETYIFQLRDKAEIQKVDEDGPVTEVVSEEAAIAETLEKSPYRPFRYKVDVASSMQLGRNEEWKSALENYCEIPNTQLMKILNPRRGTTVERFELYQKLDSFVSSCIREIDKASNKRAREEEGNDDTAPNPQDITISVDSEFITVTADEEDLPALIELSNASPTFKMVKTRFDLAVLENCSAKLRRMILDTSGKSKKKNKEGYLIQVYSRRSTPVTGGGTYSSAQEKSFVNPLVLRVPASMTVYGLREALSKRLVRSLRIPKPVQRESAPCNERGGTSSESDVIPMEGDSELGDDENVSGVASMNVSSDQCQGVDDHALLIMRQIPLSYFKKKTHTYGQAKACKKLGSLQSDLSSDGNQPVSLASPTDEDEQQLVSDWVGDKGTVYLEWPTELSEQAFDENEFESKEQVKDPDEEEAIAERNRKSSRPVTILDCVEKYCQTEQLEETEMWYCNRCKEHVRAWKQFHLYVAPPILIIHLKRFQYSASTHRRDKIGAFIDFPLTGLDLSGHVMHYEDGEKPVYDCYAVR
jgi:Ubiquitin carboxyl-terminal hydrolase